MSAAKTHRITGRCVELDETETRQSLPEALREYGDIYAIEADGRIVGLTDEYGTCHWAGLDWSTEEIERVVEASDGDDLDWTREAPTLATALDPRD